MRKIYFEHDGVQYYDYDAYFENTKQDADNHIYFDETTANNFKNIISNLKDNPTFIPAKGDEICVIPDCKYNLDDVRRNYKIKRGFDKGTCNVFSEEILKHVTDIYHNIVAVIPSKKAAIITHYYNRSDSDILKYANSIFPGLSMKDIVIIKNEYGWTNYMHVNLNDAYIGLLNGTLKTPAVHIDSLDLNTGEELTIDTLEIVHKLCEESVITYSSGWDEKLKLQLAALNGLDWRKYPGTINVLFNGFDYDYDSSILSMRSCVSRYPKNVKNFLKHTYEGFASKDDLDLACSFIRRIMGLENTQFTNLKEIWDKLEETRVCKETFITLFDNMVRFKDKDWKDE